MTIKKVGGIFQLDEKLQASLNELTGTKNYPKEFDISRFCFPMETSSNKKGKWAYSKDRISLGAVVYITDGSKVSMPLRYTIQISKRTHVIGPGLIDHDCVEPTCEIDANNNLIARKVIGQGEKISYNYLTTEYALVNKFQCTCGEEACFGLIRGFKHLSLKERKKLKEKFRLSNYLSRLA